MPVSVPSDDDVLCMKDPHGESALRRVWQRMLFQSMCDFWTAMLAMMMRQAPEAKSRYEKRSRSSESTTLFCVNRGDVSVYDRVP